MYDVTDFVAVHPGGADFILQAAGGAVDGFWDYWAYHYVCVCFVCVRVCASVWVGACVRGCVRMRACMHVRARFTCDTTGFALDLHSRISS